jgi:V8-like Glu-specific endopeptidase
VRSFEGVVKAMVHDSSTLGGNSGSAVIDTETGEVLALHFGGEYLRHSSRATQGKLCGADV